MQFNHDEQLLTEIIAGTLAPGTRLVESSLAERLGVSRTPVESLCIRARRICIGAAHTGGYLNRQNQNSLHAKG